MVKRTFWCCGLLLAGILSVHSSLAGECNPLSMTSMMAPPGALGVSYKYKVQTYGGQAPVSLMLTAGVLPAGLTFFAIRGNHRHPQGVRLLYGDNSRYQ